MARRLAYPAAVLFLLCLWWVGWRLLGDNVVPHPLATFTELVEGLRHGPLLSHLAASAWRAVAGMGLAFVLAVPLGLLLGSTPRLDRWCKPLIYLTYPLPKIVLLPVMLVVFGIGDAGKIAMLALIVFFHLLATTRDAARQIPAAAVLSLRSLGGGRLDLLRHVIWPACLPAVFTGLRVATGTTMAVLFFLETIATFKGLGYYIYDAWGRSSTREMFAGICLLALLGVVLYELFDLLERYWCRWQRVQ